MPRLLASRIFGAILVISGTTFPTSTISSLIFWTTDLFPALVASFLAAWLSHFALKTIHSNRGFWARYFPDGIPSSEAFDPHEPQPYDSTLRAVAVIAIMVIGIMASFIGVDQFTTQVTEQVERQIDNADQ